MDRVARYGLLLAGLIFGVVGLVGLLAPHQLAGSAGIVLLTPSALAEFRAAYFGTFVGCAVVFVLGARRPALRDVALVLLGTVTGCFVLGRLLSLALDGMPDALALGNLALEALGMVAAWTLLALRRRAAAD